MSNNRDLKNRASKPEFHVEKDKRGNSIARYSIEVDGKPITSEYVSSAGDAAAIQGARERFDKLMSEKYREVYDNGIEATFGEPVRTPAAAWHSRNSAGQNLDLNNDGRPDIAAGEDRGPDMRSDPLSTGEGSPDLLNKQNPDLGNVGTPEYARGAEPPAGEMTKGKPKNHVPWTKSFLGLGEDLDGTGEKELDEPVPEFFQRPGDEVIQGSNNTLIVLGRDRANENVENFSRDIDVRNYNSGYSDHMGAGAIDIVVGRGAPFPLENVGILGDILLAPSFNTYYPATLQTVKLEGGMHPGMIMDAARIYVSQMTDIDENFRIKKDIFSDPTTNSSKVQSSENKIETYPTSGIMMKADKLRFHSRQDIKIVTGGAGEAYNSQGNKIKYNNGIHLMAENGELQAQQPIPLGDNLELALDSLVQMIDGLVGALDAMTQAQIAFNQVVANHFHLVAPSGGVTATDPFSQIQGAVTNLMHIYHTQLGCFFQKVNIFGFKATYLNVSNERYINSLLNTVN